MKGCRTDCSRSIPLSVFVHEVPACSLSWQQQKNQQISAHRLWVVCPVAETASLKTVLKLSCNPSTSQAPKGSHSRKPQQVRMMVIRTARGCVFDALVVCWAGLRPIISLATLHVAARQQDGKFRETRPFQFCNGFKKAVAPMPRERAFMPTLCFPQFTIFSMRRLTDAPRWCKMSFAYEDTRLLKCECQESPLLELLQFVCMYE